MPIWRQPQCYPPHQPQRSRCVPATRSITFDTAANSGYQTAQSSYSFNVICTGDNRCVYVGVSMLSVAGSSVSSISRDGQSFTKIGSVASVSGAVRAELWRLVAPNEGVKSCTVTLSAGLDSVANAVSFNGVHQTAPDEGFNSASTTNALIANDATVNVTTTADYDWCVDVLATDDTSVSVGAGQTQRGNVSGTLGSGAMSTEGPQTPAGIVTMSWTGEGTTATWSIASVGVRPTTAVSVVTTNFRKTLSGLGGRVGVRQAVGSS